MEIEEFHYQFLSPILEKVSFENKDIYLLGDFNISLLNYESDRHTPNIKLPTRITPRSKMLIDNIFYNNFNESIISGNFITDISDHLAQFITTPKILQQESKKKKISNNFLKVLMKISLETISEI